MQFPLKIIPRSTLEIREPLGSGSFGAVSRATWQSTDVAIKELFLKELSDTLRREFEHEATIMAQFSHPNIVGLYGIVDEVGHKGLVIEYMPGGSLRSLLEDKKQEISWESRWTMAIDIGNGLRCLHDRKIVHRDLKSLNILLTESLQARIGDFGLAKIKLETSITASGTGKGTVRWCAPESFRRGFKPSSSSDIYSYGMVLWEIASREIPFADAMNEMTVMGWIKDGEQETIPADCPPGFGEVISQAWLGAQQRPRIEKLVNDLVRTKPQPAPPPPKKTGAEKSWHFDPATERQAGLAGQTDKPYRILEATAKDKQKVVSFYQHHPVPGYQIASVQVIDNRDFNLGFEVQIRKMQQKDGNPAFVPTWSTENEPQWRDATHRKLEELARPHADPDYPAVKLVPLWHGTRRDILDSVFRTGYANLATTDSGFFGKGLYGAHEAEYSWRVYGPGNSIKFKTPAEGALILNWVASFSAYPVIDGDMPKLQGKGNYGICDAHFIPVVPRNPLNPNEVSYFPWAPGQNNTYTELVTFESASCLPRYLVELQPDLVKSPVVLPPAIPPAPLPPGEQSFRTGMEFYRVSQYRQALPCFEQSAASGYPPACLYLYLIYSEGLGVSVDEARSDLWRQQVVQHAVWFREQAETGQAEAQLNLGLCYSHGLGVNKDLTGAVKYFKLAADKGNAAAQHKLGDCYCYGEGITRDLTLAVKYYQLAADQEHVQAQHWLGDCYFSGRGVKNDLTLAVKYFKLAADQGHAAAQDYLAFCYCYGKGVEKDLTLAVKYYQLAADQGNADAQDMLGGCYFNGKGVKKDMALAVKYYQLAADQGNTYAQNKLGECYYHGDGVKQDLTLAFKYYQLAADKDHYVAQFSLGHCYDNGEGVKQDMTLAVKYYQLAADRGSAKAQIKLGDCYYYGKGVEKDLTLAAKYYQLAADRRNANAQINLGDCYYDGKGVEKDLTLAAKYYQLAADQGNAAAQNKLGMCYYYGDGVEKDLTLAAKYYQLAANQGNAAAQNKLGECYYHGDGVKEDLTLAVKYYQLAADQDHRAAQFSLGHCYDNEEGVKQDLTLAVKYYQLAADQGHADAQFSLGACYYDGDGVNKDLTRAVKYFQLAADQGHADARLKLHLLQQNAENGAIN